MLLSLSFMHTGCSTAVVGSFRCCWAVNVACWALAIVCRSWSSLCMVVNLAVDVYWAAGVVCGGGCVMWQWATWRVHSLLSSFPHVPSGSSSCMFLSYLQVLCCLNADQGCVQPSYLGCIFRNCGLLQTTCTNVPSLLNLESFACTPFVGRVRSSSRA